MLALADCNNAYCSMERCFAPHLRGKPLVVLSSNDGACIARSNEAKALGVKMAQPWFEVKHLEKSDGLIALSANFELYADMSSRMMSVLGRYAPKQEVYSIDESFLDFEGVRGDLTAIARKMRAAVWQEVGLPTCVGLGPTKTLAKLANHVAKSAERKPGSYPAHLAQVCHLGAMSREELEPILAATEVGDVWGIGPRISARLKAGCVHTVLDFIRADPASLRKEFSVVLEKTLLELRGTPCLTVEEAPAARQQIMVSRSFGSSIAHADGIVEAVSEFASRAAEKLRSQDSVAGAVNVFFHTSPFRKNDRQHHPQFTIPLPRPTADTRQLVAVVAAASRQLFRPGFNYVKAGVMLMDLQPADQVQAELDLFGDEPEDLGGQPSPRNRPKLMEAMDALNHRFGRNSVRIGSTTVASSGSSKRSWAVRSERRTPRYTTRWDEMPVVKC